MTKKEFKQALLRGQGRCLIAAKENPMKFYNIVIWACGHRVAYDPQCEGTRSTYVYELINCYYDDTAPFLNEIIANLDKVSTVNDWELLYFAELLSDFALDGSNEAREALWRKYDALYTKLLRIKKRPKNVFFDCCAFERLCLTLITDFASVAKIAEDIGRLYSPNTIYCDDEFDWLVSSIEKSHMTQLIKKAKKSKYIAQFVRLREIYDENLAQIRNRASKALETKQLDTNADTSAELLEQYLNEKSYAKRRKILEELEDVYSADPEPLLQDATSNNDELRAVAWRVLEKIRHPKVRAFAIKQLDTDLEKALPLFIKNYEECDEQLLIKLVKSVPVDFESRSDWHSIHMDVLFMKDDKLKAPVELLYYIYENTYCSYCREFALDILAKRRLLTNNILQECLYDSSTDIRKFAKRHLK